MRHPRIPSVLMVVVLGAALLGPAPVQASVGIAVAPALIELDGAAGDTGSVDITVSNRGDEAYDAVAAIEPFEGMTGERSAVEWSHLTPQQVHVEPGASGSIRLTVTIPPDAASGGNYAQVSVTTRAMEAGHSASTTASAIAGRVIIPVFLSVNGQGELTQEPTLLRTALFLEADGSLGLRAELHNDGDVHVPLMGSATLTSPSLATPATIDIGLGRLLPGRSRTYAGGSTIPLTPGATYEVVLDMGMPDQADPTTFSPTLRGEASALATPELTLDDLSVCVAEDGTPRLRMTLHDTGSIGVVPTAGFRILDPDGAQLASLAADVQGLAWPGTDTAYAGTVPVALPEGAYILVGGVLYASGGYLETQVPFTIGGGPATAAGPCPDEPSPSGSPAT